VDILYLLIPLSVFVAGLLLWGVLWAVRSGQYDDPDGNAHRILMDDDDPRIPPSASSTNTQEFSSEDKPSRVQSPTTVVQPKN
jgi:cbb3-type cytochrome oxidase maturation protein